MTFKADTIVKVIFFSKQADSENGLVEGLHRDVERSYGQGWTKDHIGSYFCSCSSSSSSSSSCYCIIYMYIYIGVYCMYYNIHIYTRMGGGD